MFHWLLPNFVALASLAVAVTVLVWLCTQDWDSDQLRGTYVPKRLRASSQFIEWIKSRIKTTLFDRFEAAIYSIKVSRTRADRLRRRRRRRLPGVFALLYALLTLPWSLFSSMLSVLQAAPLLFAGPIAVTVFAATSACRGPLIFDADSFPILVDSGATHSFTPRMDDFIEPPKAVRKRVQGVRDSAATYIGTVAWPIVDDDGHVTQQRYEGVYFCKDMPYRVLSPQHWAQYRKDFSPIRSGTRCVVDADSIVLEWDQRTHRRTMPLQPETRNVGLMYSGGGYHRFQAFCTLLHVTHVSTTADPVCFATHVIPPDDDEEASAKASEGDEPPVHLHESSTSSDGAPSASEGETRAPAGSDGETRAPVGSDGAPLASEGAAPLASEGAPAAPDAVRNAPIVIDFASDELPSDEADDDVELAKPQEELMRLHIRLGHLPFFKLRAMAQSGLLPRKILHCTTPKCAACMYAKATRRPWRSNEAGQPVQPRQALTPGACVSIDQLESSTPGLVAQLKGIPTKARYRAATVFVDHFSRFSYVYFQKSLSAEETVEAKRRFEIYANSYGVKIRHYHADNGRFAENLFIQEVAKERQSISFCGVNAHWQNGIAERRIRELQDQARTNLVYASHRWPNAVSVHLWPYAVRHVNEVFNSTPHSADQLPPVSRFTGSAEHPKTKHFHHFGCPVYVTDNAMQQGRKGSKWMSRARLGLYLGVSPIHSSSVALVLNLRTGLASPQYHIAFDDMFETVQQQASDSRHDLWQEVTGFKDPAPASIAQRTSSPESSPTVSPSWVPTGTPTPPVLDPVSVETHVDASDPRADPDLLIGDLFNRDSTDDGVSHDRGTSNDTSTGSTPSPPISIDHGGLRRSNRRRIPTQRLLESGLPMAFSSQIDNELLYYENCAEERLQAEMRDPIAFAARASDPDTMHYHQAMKQPDRAQFIKAMKEEVQAHIDNGHWELIPRSEVPAGTKILSAVWAMRRKRRIATQEVYKWKARLNVHGGQQEKGVNYWETFAPVVQWTSIRLFLIVALLNGWHTRQIDFVLAYPQADIECDLYMEVPPGFHVRGSRKDWALKLKKNLYGQKQAGRVWNQHLHVRLTEKLGFTQSAIDPCVYYRGTLIMMVYVDDNVLVSPDASEIEQVIADLKQHFNITDEGEIDDYLGVKVERLPDGSIKLSQPHLIDSILKDLHYTRQLNPATTPAASTVILDRDVNGRPFDESFHYRAAIGKLNFLEKSTRPEIAYAVHQAARFSVDPKESHGRAVRRLCRYLAGTRDKGIVLKPTLEGNVFQVWVDADFLGLWNKETALDDPSTARSRTGYVITYAGCPVSWISRLQTEVAHSSTEAEYVALSQALRDAIPMMGLLKEASDLGVPITSAKPTFRCTVFEDNAGCVELANVPKMRPRTRHINLKYHHFREFVAKKVIQVLKVDGDDQLADLLTKPLADDKFIFLRHGLLGW
jgi:Reverse transcriptase (RNA-dependent DNA polymerase)